MILKDFYVSFSSISLDFQKETIGNSINSLTGRPAIYIYCALECDNNIIVSNMTVPDQLRERMHN